jgi:hypothetical protein
MRNTGDWVLPARTFRSERAGVLGENLLPNTIYRISYTVVTIPNTYFSFTAAIPGSSFPSKYSSIAPPPVDT